MNKEVNGIIYKATNLVNGRQYIGQTIRKLNIRINGHKSDISNSIISRAIKKYGSDWFDWKIIDTASTIDELNEKEIYWIKELNTLSPNGYNLKTGGLNGLHSEESKRKVSLANSGKIHSNETKKKLSDMRKGIKFSEEHKRNLSKSKTGIPLLNETKEKIRKTLTGRKLTEETKEKLRGKIKSEETRKKASLSISKYFLEFDNKTLNIPSWAKELNIPESRIRNRLKNKKNKLIEYILCKSKLHRNRFLTFNDKTLSIKEWSNLTGIKESTILNRLNVYNWSIEKTLTTKVDILTIKLDDNYEYSIKELSEKTGLHKDTIRGRLKRGWSINDILTKKTNEINAQHRLITYNGITLNLNQWGKKLNINSDIIRQRLNRGWSIENALNTAIKK